MSDPPQEPKEVGTGRIQVPGSDEVGTGRIQAMRDAGRYGTIGLELLAFLGIGYGIGHFVERRFAVSWGVPAGIAFGLFGGFWNLWKVTKKIQAALEREDRLAGRKFVSARRSAGSENKFRERRPRSPDQDTDESTK